MVPADPYPWPYDGAVDPRTLALVIAGGQRAWMEHSTGAAGVMAAIERLAAALRDAGALVVHIRHGSPAAQARPAGLPPTAGSPRWVLATEVEPGDLVVDAGGVDGFFAGPLDGTLRAHGITHLALAGFGAEAAVDSTLRSANDRGYECLTLTDAVAPFDPETGRRALASVTMSGGIFGAIATSEQLLLAISRPALLEVL